MLRTAKRTSSSKLGMKFNAVNPRAVEWAQKYAATLVQGITDETRNAIRALIVRSIKEGIPPRQLAKLLREIIGLTERQGAALIDYRERLIDEGEDMIDVEDEVSARAGEMLNYRAGLIAHSEGMRSANMGTQMLWEQAVEEGQLTGEELKEFITTPDERICPICLAMDGQLAPLNGSFVTPGGEEYDTPPIHPNSIIANVVVEGNTIAATRMLYAGQVREIVTSSGRTLTITPNHAVATLRGFVFARYIKKGDYLLAYDERFKVDGVRISPVTSMSELPENKQHGPAEIEQIFHALQLIGKFVTTKRFGDEFHGDAAYGDSDIDVVYADVELGNSREATLLNQRQRLGFESSDSFAPSFSDPLFMDHRVRFGSEIGMESKVVISVPPPKTCRVGLTSRLDTVLLEMRDQFGARDARFCSELQDRLPGLVTQDEVIDVRNRRYEGHVYDLQTVSEVIVAQGLIISNCRCTLGISAQTVIPRAAETAFRTAVIRKVGTRFYLYTKDGRKILGRHKTYAEAEAQERAIANRHAEFNPDQARDENGQWTIGGGSSLRPTRTRAFSGEPSDSVRLSKLETGALGERLAIDYLKAQGFADARTLNEKGNNFPVDLVQDHEVFEVKAGLASNSESAQQWRATIGQPGVKERAWLAKASDGAKARWGERKQQAIMARKERAVLDVSKRIGHAVKGKTLSLIVNPSTRVVDVYEFPGFHARIAWKSDEATKGYRGSYKY